LREAVGIDSRRSYSSTSIYLPSFFNRRKRNVN